MKLVFKIIIVILCRVSDCEELVGTISTKKAVSSKDVELIYGSKGDMSRRKNAHRKAGDSR